MILLTAPATFVRNEAHNDGVEYTQRVMHRVMIQYEECSYRDVSM